MEHLLAKSIMTKDLITISAGDSLEVAYGLMRANRIRHLPVVNNMGDLVGLLSDRDVQRAKKVYVAELGTMKVIEEEFPKNMRVADYMSWPVAMVSKETELLKVTEIMIEKKFSSLLVVDGNQLAGIVTNEDLLKLLASMLRKEKDGLMDEVNYLSPIGSFANMLSGAGI